MGILNNSNAISVDSGYDITDSLRFRSSASAYLNRTPASDGNRRTWTWSCWVKRGSLATSGIALFGTQNDSANSDYDVLYFDGNKCRLLLNGGTGQLNTTQVFRDSSAWYHIVLAIDTTQATDTNRMKMYINGVQVTAFDTATYVSVNYDTWVNKGGRVATIGAAYQSSANNYLDGYLTEVNFVDGTALTPSDFGESDSNGTWIPKKYTGTYGTNGFYLPMKPTTQATGFNTVLYTGNGGTQAMTNVGFNPDFVWIKRRSASEYHVLFDTVRGLGNGKALYSAGTEAEGTYRYGNVSATSDKGFTVATGTSGIGYVNQSGESYVGWCWDAGTFNTGNTNVFNGSSQSLSVVGSSDMALGTGDCTVECYFKVDSLVDYRSIIDNRPSSASSAGFSIDINANGSIYNYSDGFIVQSANGVISAGVWYHVAYTRASGTHRLFVNGAQVATSSTSRDYTNDDIFIGRAPYGGEWFDGQISNVRIVKGTAVYTSNFALGTSNLTAVTNTKLLTCQSTTIVDNSGLSQTIVNEGTVVASTNPLFVTNSNDGTLTSTVKANPSTGFSIVTYTGTGSNATIGHGLGVAPKMIIAKSRSYASTYWLVGHDTIGWTKGLYLNATNAVSAAYTPYWNNTAPDSDKFTLGTWTDANGSGHTNVAYCFADVTGYQKIDSYTGNGSATGPTITTGFRPAFVMVKRTDVAKDWIIIDNTRDVNNPAKHRLFPNLSDAESTSQSPLELLDDGFKVVVSDSNYNASGGTYIYLAIKDTRDEKFNFDASGNKNNWTPNNINSNASGESTYDLMSDVPTLTDEDTSNFATLNPVAISNGTLSNGNLTWTPTGNSASAWSTIAVNTGKWYFEMTKNSGDAFISISQTPKFNGFQTDSDAVSVSLYMYYASGGSGGNRFLYNSSTTAFPSGFGNDDVGTIYGVTLDFDADQIIVRRNNDDSTKATFSIPAALKAKPLHVGYSVYTTWTGGDFSWNFGQRPFAYTPPTGFKKLNTFNLPDSTITDGSEHFDTALYTGTGSSLAITGLEFSPDLVWTKGRDVAYSHYWFDSVRGVGNRIMSNSTSNEDGSVSGVTSFDTNGFTLGTDVGANNSGSAFVGWNWKGSDSTAVSNTDGDITSTVSANTTAGFSIVTYTGTGTAGDTVGHGLGANLGLLITKPRSISGGWAVASTGLGVTGDTLGGFPESYYIALNATGARANNGESVLALGNASKFAIGSGLEMNQSGATYVAYCFTPIEGYSKFGSYTGNGSADGPFIYTGFRPAFLILKQTDTTRDWQIHDTARNPNNVSQYHLKANDAGAEGSGSGAYLDIVSNGFKLRTSGAGHNNSGGTYMYMAFAENPFKNSNAR